MRLHKSRFDVIIEKLKQSNHKITPQRIAIVKILSESQDHPSVEAIHKALKKDFPTMSLATIYRNILLIKTLGEVIELEFSEWSNRYDGKRPYSHPHVICIECKKIVEPNLSHLEDMQNEVADETGFKILRHRLDFFGICSDCRIKKK